MLPTEMAGLVKSKVASGEYATESEVIRDGLRITNFKGRTVIALRPTGWDISE